ncbi:MAG: ABC transporter substrate-binding protein [Candidatus Bathyarchaeia archaeon]|jgi:iron complex transport system substrate-binding protein
MKTIYKIAAVLIVVLVVSTAGFVAYNGTLTNSGTNTQKSTITVTDMENRTVTLNVPVERVVITSSSYTEEFAEVYGDGFADLIVGWDNEFETLSGDILAKYIEMYPQLADMPDVGSLSDDTFSAEKAIALKPDVIFLQSWDYVFYETATKNAVTRLEQAGIPVIFLDYWVEPMTNSPKSMSLLGEIFGKQERAQQIVDFYNEQINLVYSRLANVTGPKPTVYVEGAWVTPPEYGGSYGDVSHGAIIKLARGDNIAEPLLGTTGAKALSAEYVISQNPDIVIFTGRNWSTPSTVRLGYATTIDVARSTISGFVERPGWDTLNAVKNHQVYAVHHGYVFSIKNFAILQAFATWFYPAEFQDIDPNAVLAEYFERFSPIPFAGTFICSYY